MVTFISSSANSNVGNNTAAWVNLTGTGTPSASQLQSQITTAANSTCQTSTLATGQDIPTNNGMIQSVFDTLSSTFTSKFNASGTITLTNANGDVVYSGKGWEVFTPVIHCDGGAISGNKQIVGWTKFVMTQVIDKGQCAVANHNPVANPWDPRCPAPNGTSTASPDKNFRGLYGYFSCTLIPTNPVPAPVPRAALGTKLRLVK